MTHEQLIGRAIRLSVENVAQGGGPFGAVVARGGEIGAEGVNRVTALNDPTAHAEVQAIRLAAQRLGRFDLSDCELYASCEPCPMCLGAIYWARLSRLYYAATQHDAAAAGFDDALIYREMALAPSLRRLPTASLSREEALEAFRRWREQADRIDY